MRFACEQCQTKYSIPDERVRGKILKIRCKTCGCLISVSEGGVRTARPVEAAEAAPGLASTESESGDSTMIGGMADFFGKLTPPTEGDDWHLSIDGNQNGPMPLNDLAQRVLEQADTSSELFVWREGFDGWKTADNVPEIQVAVEKARGSGLPKSAAASLGKSGPPPSLASESEGGDATQIGSLNLGFDAIKGDTKGGDDDDVQDASMLSLDADALEAFSSAVAASKPAAKPAMPPPLKAPPPFKAPTSPMFRTLPHPGGRPLSSAAAPPPKPAAPPPPAPPTPAPPPPVVPTPTPAAPPPPEPDLASLFPQGANVSSPAPSNSGLGSSSASGSAPPVLPSSEPSVMAALQFSGPAFDGLGMAAPTQPAPVTPSKSGSKLPLVAGLGLLLALGGVGGIVMWSKSGKNKSTVTDGEGAKADAGAAADGGAGADAGTKAGAGVKNPPKKSAELEGIEEADFKSLLESGESALGKCYSKAIKKDASLSGETLKVEVEVTGKGKASEVTLDGKEADGKLGKCMQKAVKKWKFAKGPDKKPYKIRFPLTVKE